MNLTWPSEHDVEVQPVDTDGGVVFDAQVNVLLDTEAEVTRRREVVAAQLVFSYL